MFSTPRPGNQDWCGPFVQVMFDAAKKLIAADIRDRCPGISPAELRVQTFAWLHFGDFDPETMVRISAALR